MKVFSVAFLLLTVSQGVLSQAILAKHEFEAEGVKNIQVNGKFCNVNVSNGDKVQFFGVIEGKGKKGDFEISSILSGTTLFIEVNKKFEGPWNKLSKAEIEVTVPDDTKVTVENSSGDVVIRNLTGPGFNIKTTSGDQRLYNLTGALNLASTSGDIYLYKAIGPLIMETTSGNQEVDMADSDIKTNATSGNLEFSGVVGNIIAETTSGDISLRESVGFLKLQSTSGDISGTQVSVSEKSSLKASSGDIQIRFKDSLDRYFFDVQSTSGFLRIGEMHGEKNLKSTHSGVEIYAVTTSGDQYYTN